MFPLIQENTNNNHHRNVKVANAPKKHFTRGAENKIVLSI